MDFKFSKDSENVQQEAPDEKRKQSALAVLLLILIGGFTYVYFFTGLVKPQEVQKPADIPVTAAPQIVKMPLPPRDGEAVKAAEKAAAAPAGSPKDGTPAVAASAVPAAKPAAAPPKPAAVPAAVPPKPAAAPAPKPKEEPKKADVVKPTDKKPLPVSAAEKKAAIPAPKPEVKKAVETEKKIAPAKETTKKAATTGAVKAKSAEKVKPATSGSWSLMVGNYVLEEALSADMGRVRKSGFEPKVKPATRKKSTMNRLYVSEFNDRVTAQSTLEKLRKHTSDAFVIEQGGKFVVYAGSYLHNGAANSEKERLKAAGFTTTLKHADIAIPSQSLSIGPFTSKKAAETARDALKKTGVTATLSQP